jgi:hypothetical protein
LKTLHRRQARAQNGFAYKNPDAREVIDDARFDLADKAVARTILFLPAAAVVSIARFLFPIQLYRLYD